MTPENEKLFSEEINFLLDNTIFDAKQTVSFADKTIGNSGCLTSKDETISENEEKIIEHQMNVINYRSKSLLTDLKKILIKYVDDEEKLKRNVKLIDDGLKSYEIN